MSNAMRQGAVSSDNRYHRLHNIDLSYSNIKSPDNQLKLQYALWDVCEFGLSQYQYEEKKKIKNLQVRIDELTNESQDQIEKIKSDIKKSEEKLKIYNQQYDMIKNKIDGIPMHEKKKLETVRHFFSLRPYLTDEQKKERNRIISERSKKDEEDTEERALKRTELALEKETEKDIPKKPLGEALPKRDPEKSKDVLDKYLKAMKDFEKNQKKYKKIIMVEEYKKNLEYCSKYLIGYPSGYPTYGLEYLEDNKNQL